MRKLILLLVLCTGLGFGQTALPAPPIRPPYLDLLGHALAGGFLYTSDSGTSTPEGTWTDFTGTVANSNPIVLDSFGYPQPSGTVWLTPSISYRFCLQNSSHVQQYCIDGIAGLLPTSTGGSVTNVTASAPLASSGGAAPNISATTSGNGVQLQSTSMGAGTTNGRVVTTDALGNTVQSATLLSALATLASPNFSGNPLGPSPAVNDNDTSLATTAFVHTQLLSGTQLLGNTTTANTQASSDNSTKLATTAFVKAAAPQVIASGTLTGTSALINSDNCGAVVTVAAVGTLTSDTIIWAISGAPGVLGDSEMTYNWWVTAGNVNMRICDPLNSNFTPSGTIFNWRVIR